MVTRSKLRDERKAGVEEDFKSLAWEDGDALEREVLGLAFDRVLLGSS